MSWLRVWFRRQPSERQLDAELQFHIEEQVRDYVATGLSPEEALRKVRLSFGGTEQIKEECRDQRPLRLMDDFVRDIRFALRTFRRNPGFTVVSVLTLGLGIGAATAVFTVFYSMLVRPLPFPEAERLVFVRHRMPPPGDTFIESRMSQFREWYSRATLFESVGAYDAYFTHASYNLTGRGEPERWAGVEVSQSFFPLLGVRAAVGRLFREGEDLPGARPVVVLSFQLWQRRFGGSPTIVGETVTLNEQPRTVVGVLSPDFNFASTFAPGAEIDIYVPLLRDQAAEQYGGYLAVLGRLKPNVSPEQAQAELTSIHQALAQGEAVSERGAT